MQKTDAEILMKFLAEKMFANLTKYARMKFVKFNAAAIISPFV